VRRPSLASCALLRASLVLQENQVATAADLLINRSWGWESCENAIPWDGSGSRGRTGLGISGGCCGGNSVGWES
jgi:hypothetical protein